MSAGPAPDRRAREPARDARAAGAAGFTLLELIIAMGLLSTFLLLLVQLLGSGVGVFHDGERSQDVADRVQAASRAVTEALSEMVGPGPQRYEQGPPDARLLCTWEPLGLSADAGPKLGKVQVIRATVTLGEEEEQRLLREMLRPEVEHALRRTDTREVETRLDELLAEHPRRGRADMMLLAWPVGDAQFLTLRRGLFVDQGFGEEGGLSLMEVERPGSEDLPAELIPQLTEVIAQGLLHVEFAFWSQDTDSWQATPGETGRGPELVWDSARAGLLSESQDPRERFGKDLGPDSLEDTRDDVFPRWVRVTLVVARGPGEPPEAILLDDLAAADKTMRLTRTEGLPTGDGERFVKVGTEWIGFAGAGPTEVQGLVRGLRRSPAVAHPAGTPVRAGRTIERVVKLQHGRDG